MGFEYEPEEYQLTFADVPGLAGLEVTATSVPMADLLRYAVLLDVPQDVTPQDVQDLWAERVGIFARALRSWNLERDGQPVGTDAASIQAQDSGLVMRVMAKWWIELNAVPAPLPGASSSGGSSGLEASIPMETPSPSQPS